MNEYFSDVEFQCSCGCKLDITDELKQRLLKARKIAKTPFVINSGARCRKHNDKIGGRKTSSHLSGLAVDIAAVTSRERSRILTSLIAVGITRIGIADTFIHGDIDTAKVQDVVWTY